MNATLNAPLAPFPAMPLLAPMLPALVVPSQSGRFLDAGDHRGHVLISSAQSGGDFVLFDMEVDAHGGPPPHVHEFEDETFIVQSGRFEAVLGEEVALAGPGDTIFAPRGIPHVWRCISEEGGRMMVIITPGENFERFFTEMIEGCLLTLPQEEALPALNALSKRHGLQMFAPVVA